MGENVKEGLLTSEFERAKSAGVWGIVAIILGAVTTIGSVVIPTLDQHSTAGIIAGALLSVVGVIGKTLADLGYVKSRTEVKVAASLASAEKKPAE